MRREVTLSEISDGRLYGLNDMVKAGCDGCKDCFSCCCGMGTSIVLDPLDMHRLARGLGESPAGLPWAGTMTGAAGSSISSRSMSAGRKPAPR